jgi:hypothetical protein
LIPVFQKAQQVTEARKKKVEVVTTRRPYLQYRGTSLIRNSTPS